MLKLIKSTSFYAIGNVLPQAIGFFLLPIYTKYLTPTDYGIVNSMQVLSGVLLVFFTLAIDRSVNRLYFDFKTEKDRKVYMGTIALSLFFTSVIVLLLLFVFSGLVGQIYKSISFYPYYVYMILSTFFGVFAIIPKKYYQVTEQANVFVAISTGQFLLSTGFVLWYVVHNAGAEGMLKGQMLASIIGVPICIYILYRSVNFSFKYKILKESLLFSLPMIPNLFLAWILNLSDRVFIERYFNLHDVGIYSLGYKIAGLVLIFTSAFSYAYNPLFYRLASSDNQKKAKKTLYKYNSIYLIALLLVTFLVSFFSKEAIEYLLSPKYLEAYKIVPIIAFAYLISQISNLFNLMIYQKKKSVKLMYVGITGAVMNILLNFLLIPILGIYGAAYSTVLSFLVVFILSWFYARKYYYIPLNLKNFLLTVLLMGIVSYLFMRIELPSMEILLIKILFTLLVILVIFLFYRKEIKFLTQNVK